MRIQILFFCMTALFLSCKTNPERTTGGLKGSVMLLPVSSLVGKEEEAHQLHTRLRERLWQQNFDLVPETSETLLDPALLLKEKYDDFFHPIVQSNSADIFIQVIITTYQHEISTAKSLFIKSEIFVYDKVSSRLFLRMREEISEDYEVTAYEKREDILDEYVTRIASKIKGFGEVKLKKARSKMKK